MFNDSFNSLQLPETLNQALISLILIKNKDPLSCASFRPISLLNVNFQLLSKLLALRIEAVTPTIISPDQTGFIRNRHSFFNLRRLFNTIYHKSTTPVSVAVISLDAERPVIAWSGAIPSILWDNLALAESLLLPST